MDLIPGLPNEVGLECLNRVPFDHFPVATSVCRKWKDEIMKAEFRNRRKASGRTRPVIAMAQAMVVGSSSGLSPPIYRLTLLDPVKGCWSDLPPIPEMVEGLPVFSRVVGVGPELAVMGGCDPQSFRVLNSVFIYSFLTGTWRRGKDMPGEQRLFFGCAASERDGVVVVAGGHDDGKNALKSTLSYDVASDVWAPLPDMSSGRDECACFFYRGKCHVTGGYHVETQGRFERTVETLDAVAGRWCANDGMADAAKSTFPSVGFVEIGGRIYTSRDGDVVAFDDVTSQVIGRVPREVSSVSFVTGWHGQLMVTGNAKYGEPQKAYVFELKSGLWNKIEVPNEYSGHIQSGFCLDL
ncbi:unnamed protein product [Cuscuta epithymum]|uniref:F-box domain-containing protein n=1 Tax=Cuscuta epithymum TaxID=186058 RepID=A0AAV0GHL9_9ASTE|nr:unnamed protein product [Cuscuta epithymum]